MTAWRIVRGPDGPGALQMALDRAVQEARIAGAVPPTLRLYRFDPPTVTIGRFQDVSDIDVDVVRSHGWGIARRPTGGRGVLHADELTYSIVAGLADGVPRGVAASYRYLCSALVEAYQILGVPAELVRRDRSGGTSGACYLHTTRADLALGAAKLSGSAQVWQDDVCLQHGSFVISRDVVAEAGVFCLDSAERDALDGGSVTLSQVARRIVSIDEIADAVVAGLEAALGVRAVAGELTDAELLRANEIESQYAVSV